MKLKVKDTASLAALGTPRARVGLLAGCVQSVVFGDVNAATARVLAADGFEVVTPQLPCCGALHAHSGRLEQARIAYGRVSTLDDVAQHPQNRYVEVQTPSGIVRMLAPGALIDGTLPSFRAVPALGADTDRLIKEFLR